MSEKKEQGIVLSSFALAEEIKSLLKRSGASKRNQTEAISLVACTLELKVQSVHVRERPAKQVVTVIPHKGDKPKDQVNLRPEVKSAKADLDKTLTEIRSLKESKKEVPKALSDLKKQQLEKLHASKLLARSNPQASKDEKKKA
jgi:hypothetical protein